MKSFVALFALVAVAAADVSHIVSKNGEAAAEIIEQKADVFPDQYQFGFRTSNGIQSQESGSLKQVGTEAAIAASGSFAYTAPDGSPIETSYVADEFGFQPKGAHLPTPPPTQPYPEYIVRALEFIRTHPTSEASKNY